MLSSGTLLLFNLKFAMSIAAKENIDRKRADFMTCVKFRIRTWPTWEPQFTSENLLAARGRLVRSSGTYIGWMTMVQFV